jgi:hypothetical protein
MITTLGGEISVPGSVQALTPTSAEIPAWPTNIKDTLSFILQGSRRFLPFS